MKKKLYKDRDWLYKYYIEENLTTTEIAAIAGVTNPTIATTLRKFNIKKTKEKLQKARNKKIKETSLKKYGVEHPFQSEEVKSKIKDALIEKYGVDNPLKSTKIKKKVQKTNLEKYGEITPSKNKDIIEKSIQRKVDLGFYNLFENGDSIMKLCEENNVPFSSIYKLYKENNLELSAIKEIILNYSPTNSSLEIYTEKLFNISFYNKYFDLQRFPELRYKPDFILNDKIVLNVDGLYWHSNKNKKDKKYHFNLRKDFEDRGLRIIQFREDEIYNKQEIVKSIVNNCMGNSRRIYARKTKFVRLKTAKAREFFNKNHLMGYTNSKAFGLIKDNELVMAASIKVFKDKIKIERLCSKCDYLVIGGASKLFKNILKETPFLPIYYWSDLRYGTGNYLEKLGFTHIKDTLGFKWTDFSKTYNRLACRANMDNRLLSEKFYAEERGWCKIYDAGQRLWIKNNP